MTSSSRAGSVVHRRLNGTLTELQVAMAAGIAPSQRLAVRAGALASNATMTGMLLRCAGQNYLAAGRLWQHIAGYLDDVDQRVAVLRLAAQCWASGGNTGLARKCMDRAAAVQARRC
jgi:hypothetical protein